MIKLIKTFPRDDRFSLDSVVCFAFFTVNVVEEFHSDKITRQQRHFPQLSKAQAIRYIATCTPINPLTPMKSAFSDFHVSVRRFARVFFISLYIFPTSQPLSQAIDSLNLCLKRSIDGDELYVFRSADEKKEFQHGITVRRSDDLSSDQQEDVRTHSSEETEPRSDVFPEL